MTDALTIFREIATEFSAVADATVENWIERASNRHTAASFGAAAVFAEAMAYYAAHLMKMQERAAAASGGGGGGAGVGSVTSHRAGKWAVGYGGTGSASSKFDKSEQDLLQTTYGMTYLSIVNTRSAVFPTQIIVGAT